METKQTSYIPVLFTLCFPTALTAIYFVVLADRSAAMQQTVYSVGKIIQFGFPACWVLLIRKEAFARPVIDKRGLVEGIGFGVLTAGVMIGLYGLILKPSGFFEGPGLAVREKILGVGMDQAWKFVILAVFYSLVHSLLEEYYWRWFVFRELRKLAGLPVSLVVSSVGFTAHHVILLAVFFGWDSMATWLFSLGVCAGGAVWAFIYERSKSIYSPWLSHLLVDAAIFAIGYDLVR